MQLKEGLEDPMLILLSLLLLNYPLSNDQSKIAFNLLNTNRPNISKSNPNLTVLYLSLIFFNKAKPALFLNLSPSPESIIV